MIIQHIADLVDDNDPYGRTYRQINLEKTHNIPIGTLVEMNNGVRLFVAKHTRDCDETPLYSLGFNKMTPLIFGIHEESIEVLNSISGANSEE